MAKEDKKCTAIRICLNKEINKEVEKFKAEQLIQDVSLTKTEATEKYIQKIFDIAKPLMK